MSFVVTHLNGEMERDVPFSHFEDLLAELKHGDAEHFDVSVKHESEWCVSFFKSGRVVLENLEEGEPMNLGPVQRADAIEIMNEIAEGRIGDARSRPWRPGYE